MVSLNGLAACGTGVDWEVTRSTSLEASRVVTFEVERDRTSFEFWYSSVPRLCHPCYPVEENVARMAKPGHG